MTNGFSEDYLVKRHLTPPCADVSLSRLSKQVLNYIFFNKLIYMKEQLVSKEKNE